MILQIIDRSSFLLVIAIQQMVSLRNWYVGSNVMGGELSVSFIMNKRFAKQKLAVRALGGALIITLVELICGCIVNLKLGLDVWDYSHIPLNLFGQICLPFTLLWFLLCFPICIACNIFCRGKRAQN